MPILNIRAIQGEVPLIAQIRPCLIDETFPILLPPTFADPSDTFSEDLRWYIEDFARNDSFSVRRSQAVETKLQSYGSSLAQAICVSDAVLADLFGCDLMIEIDGYGGYSPRLSQIHWEILEDVMLWNAELRPCRVTVGRRADALDAVGDLSYAQGVTKTQSSRQHILAVSARPNLERDIPYRLITRTISETIGEEQDGNPNPPTLEIVRPGTFLALETALAGHPIGHYDIVHFDLHGFVLEGNAFLKFLLPNEDLVGAEDVPLSRIAKLLASHGVGAAVLNACQSASEQSATSNIARSMVEQGVKMAIGMRFEILDSAAAIFTKNLYRQILRHKRSMFDATRIARFAMRKDPKRRTKFNMVLNIQDAITPILFSKLPFGSSELYVPEVLVSEASPQHELDLFGREDDILAIETKLLTSNVLLLNGSAGTGKTYFVEHLCHWWKATGFIEDYVVLDCAKMGDLNVVKIQAAIAYAFGLTSTENSANVLTYVNQHRCLIVIDSLDAARMQDEVGSTERQSSLRRFLRKIKKSFVIIISRHGEDWIKAAAKVTYILKNLNMKSSLQMATKQVVESGHELDMTSNMNSRFLEQCIYLVDGNPLAIELLMKAFVSSGMGIQEFYNKLTDGSLLDQARPGLFGDSRSRGFLDAQHLVRQNIGPHPARVVCDTDFRLLRPFWRTFPLDILPYRLVFLWAKARISKADEPTGFASQLKYTAERMENKERSILFGSSAFQDSDISNLAPMTAAFESCEREGFLSKTLSGATDDEEIHMKVHPLLSLALRQQQFAVPAWLNHTIEVAFQRFHYYRSRHWPNTEAMTPSWNFARAQLSFEFANYITANNLSLRVKADHRNVFLLKRVGQLAFCLANNPRRMPVVLDVLNRFLAIFGTPLTKGPSMLLSAWSSAFDMVKKRTKTKYNDVFSDARGMIEMLCIIAIMYAAQYASSLNIDRDYSPMLEGIANNFLPNSDFADVNLPLVSSTRIRLLHLKDPSGDRIEAQLKALSITKSEIEEVRNNRQGPFGFLAVFNYSTLDRVKAATTLEEVEKVEQELLEMLEEQLDGIDLDSTRLLIYESLSVLAFKRGDLKLALQHCDTVLNIANNVRNVNANGLSKIVEAREKILAVQAAQSSD